MRFCKALCGGHNKIVNRQLVIVFPVDITQDTLFSAAELVFITAAVVGGVIRWSHVCHPCENNPDYYYPARKQTAIFYCAAILWFPYVLSPLDPGVCIYSRILSIVYFPVGFALLIRRYFRGRNFSFRVLWTLYLVVPALVMGTMCVSLFFGGGEWMAAHSSAVLMGGAAFGAVLTAILIGVLVWLRNRMERYNTDNYSDDEDFPYNFAKVIAYAPLAWMAAMWAVFFSGDQWLIFAVDILATLGLVGFLCVILYPQKTALPLDDKDLRVDLSGAGGCMSNAGGIGADLSADNVMRTGSTGCAGDVRTGLTGAGGSGNAAEAEGDVASGLCKNCSAFEAFDGQDGVCKYCSAAVAARGGSRYAVGISGVSNEEDNNGTELEADVITKGERNGNSNGNNACGSVVCGSAVDGGVGGTDGGIMDNPDSMSDETGGFEQGHLRGAGAYIDDANSPEEYERVKKLVIDVVRRRFREPHLLKSDVLMEIGSGDICRASRFIVSVGYYNLVNMFRLEYARLYKAKHPRAKQDEIAVEAGFSSRTSYYKAKKRVGEVDYSIVSGVEL